MKRKVLNYEKGNLPFIKDDLYKIIKNFEENSKLLREETITDDEIWKVARESKEIPNFNNIYYKLVLNKARERYLKNLKEIEEKNLLINEEKATLIYFDDINNIRIDILTDFKNFEEKFLNKK